MQPPAFLSLLVGILCVASPGLALNPEENSLSPGAVNDWVERNADNLPTDYKAFSQNSPTYRRAIYQKLDSKSKGALWANHIDSYISKHPDLTSEKLDLLQEAKDYVTSPATDEDRAQKIEDRTKTTFDQEEAQALFMHLGDNDQLPDGNDEEQRARSKRQGQHSLCECSLGSYWACCGNADCSAPPMIEACFEPSAPDGCGWLYKYKCNGLCPKGTWDGDC